MRRACGLAIDGACAEKRATAWRWRDSATADAELGVRHRSAVPRTGCCHSRCRWRTRLDAGSRAAPAPTPSWAAMSSFITTPRPMRSRSTSIRLVAQRHSAQQAGFQQAAARRRQDHVAAGQPRQVYFGRAHGWLDDAHPTRAMPLPGRMAGPVHHRERGQHRRHSARRHGHGGQAGQSAGGTACARTPAKRQRLHHV